jgi:hypothetical protein
VVVVVTKLVKIVVESHASEMSIHVEPLGTTSYERDDQEMAIGF